MGHSSVIIEEFLSENIGDAICQNKGLKERTPMFCVDVCSKQWNNKILDMSNCVLMYCILLYFMSLLFTVYSLLDLMLSIYIFVIKDWRMARHILLHLGTVCRLTICSHSIVQLDGQPLTDLQGLNCFISVSVALFFLCQMPGSFNDHIRASSADIVIVFIHIITIIIVFI